MYVYARQPYDVVLNSSANSTDGLVKKLVPAITPVRAKGFLSTLRMLPSGEEKEVCAWVPVTVSRTARCVHPLRLQ